MDQRQSRPKNPKAHLAYDDQEGPWGDADVADEDPEYNWDDDGWNDYGWEDYGWDYGEGDQAYYEDEGWYEEEDYYEEEEEYPHRE